MILTREDPFKRLEIKDRNTEDQLKSDSNLCLTYPSHEHFADGDAKTPPISFK